MRTVSTTKVKFLKREIEAKFFIFCINNSFWCIEIIYEIFLCLSVMKCFVLLEKYKDNRKVFSLVKKLSH